MKDCTVKDIIKKATDIQKKCRKLDKMYIDLSQAVNLIHCNLGLLEEERRKMQHESDEWKMDIEKEINDNLKKEKQ